MHGQHLRKRGRWWHYYRNRPTRYADVEKQSVITFALKTTCVSEAKLKAAQISRELERKWTTALERGISLQGQSAAKKYAASIATNHAYGFQAPTHNPISDQDLLGRLRFLIEGQIAVPEQKAVLGLVTRPSLSLSDAFERFWEYIQDEWMGFSHDQKRGKRNVYLKSIRHFEEALGSIAIYDIKRAHTIQFRAWWLKRKKDKGLKSYTANREINCLRRLVSVTHDIDSFDGTNPFARLRLKPDAVVRRVPLTSEQIKQNILGENKLSGIHKDFQILAKLVINTGMRPVEAIGLDLCDIILDHEVPHVHVRENSIRVLKTPHSERLIPLLGVSFDAAVQLQKQGGWGKRAGKNMYATSVINKHFRAANAFESKSQTFYSLRHWFQDQLTHLDIIDRAQAQLMGHKFHRPKYGDGKNLKELQAIIEKFAL